MTHHSLSCITATVDTARKISWSKICFVFGQKLQNKKAHAQNAHTYTNTNTRKHHIPHSEISFMEIVIHENE